MMRFLIVFLFVLFGFQIQAQNEQTNDSLFYYGVAALSNHDYEVAIGLLEQDATVNSPSFEGFYNLSQAYAALEDWNNAYFAAEKALKFAPNNASAKENVRYTLTNLNGDVSFQHPYSWVQRFILSVPSIVWFVMGIIASLIAAYFIFLILSKFPRAKTKSWAFLILCLVFAISTYFAGVFRYNQLTQNTFALSKEDNAVTHASIDGIALNQVLLLGQRYSIIDEQDNWIKLAYPDGQPVWIMKEKLFIY
jgi:tetratricopeptide (TPR) repeat protein